MNLKLLIWNEDERIIEIKEEDLIINPATQGWCGLPYKDHPKGCPNFNRRKDCPLNTFLMGEVIGPPYHLMGVSFDIEKQAMKMKEKHPNWTERQARCLLYWQGTVNKRLRILAERFVDGDESLKVINKPEAHGVDVFKMCEKIGWHLEKKHPWNFIWKIVLVGKIPNNSNIKEYRGK